MSESVNDGVRIDVGDGKSSWPSGEAVNYRKQVAKTIGMWHGDKVNVHMLKPFGWHGEIRDGWDGVALYLGLLAGKTLSGPLGHVLPHAWPDKLVCNGLTGTLNARMAEAMNHIKNASPE